MVVAATTASGSRAVTAMAEPIVLSAAPGRPAIASGIQNGKHASLQLSRPSHAHGQRGGTMAAQCIGNLEKVSGVVAGFGARAQDAVVTGQLALHPQASRPPTTPRGAVQ